MTEMLEVDFIDQLLAAYARSWSKARAEGRGLATRCALEAIDGLLDRRLAASPTPSLLDGAR